MNKLAQAIAFAANVFAESTDKGGKPYILHCLRVMNNVDQNDEELMIIAVLHDVAEDFPEKWPVSFFTKNGYSDRVTSALSLLTHNKGVPYDDYIKAISNNLDATRVKLADLKDNSDITRLKGIGKKDFDRMEKYSKAYLYLSRT